MSKFLSLEWFKSKVENSIDRVIGSKIDKLIEEIDSEEEVKKPYLNVKLVNNTLTVVMNDGSIVPKPNATEEDFFAAKGASNLDELMKIISSPIVVEEKKQREKVIRKMEAVINGIDILKSIEGFEVKDSSVYLNGINRSMPQLLVEEFLEIIKKYENCPSEDLESALNEDVEYTSLKKFWLKCCLNPNARSAEDLYGFLANHQFKIDKHGNFYTYRRVVSKMKQDTELVNFVSNAYTKVKAVWKKNTSNFRVVETSDGYSLEKVTSDECNGTILGNLTTLYLDLPNMYGNVYTSAHTGQETYKVGEIISMPRNEGDDDNQRSCSYGFHQASKAYDYSGFGDQPILSIVNPMDVLAVPVGEVGKLRVCRWFFACTLDETEKYILDDDMFDVSELGDIFEEKCSEDLVEYTHNSFVEEIKRHTFTIPEMSNNEIFKIVVSLDEMKHSISNRIKNVD